MARKLREEPTTEEVWAEFQKLTFSRKFKRAGKSLELLEYLIKKSLRGETATEDEVGEAVWNKPRWWVTQGDRSVSNARRNLIRYLAEYFVNEGVEDLLVIDTPDGSLYRAKWWYNLHSRSRQLYIYGLEATRRMFLCCGSVVLEKDHYGRGRSEEIVLNEEVARPESIFDRALALDSNHDAALTAKAEAMVVRTLFRSEVRGTLKAAEEIVGREAVSWRREVVLASVDACFGRWWGANEKLKTAVNLRAFEDMDDVLSPLLLFAIDKDKGEEICRRRANGTDGLEETLLGLMAYLDGRLEDAGDELEHAGRSDSRPSGRNDLFKFVCGCVDLTRGDSESATEWYGECLDRWDVRGFIALALAGTPEGEQTAQCVVRSLSASRFQRALASIVLGDFKAAIADVRGALDDGDPWMWFLDRWPVLEPLRRESEFVEMLEEQKIKRQL